MPKIEIEIRKLKSKAEEEYVNNLIKEIKHNLEKTGIIVTEWSSLKYIEERK